MMKVLIALVAASVVAFSAMSCGDSAQESPPATGSTTSSGSTTGSTSTTGTGSGAMPKITIKGAAR